MYLRSASVNICVYVHIYECRERERSGEGEREAYSLSISVLLFVPSPSLLPLSLPHSVPVSEREGHSVFREGRTVGLSLSLSLSLLLCLTFLSVYTSSLRVCAYGGLCTRQALQIETDMNHGTNLIHPHAVLLEPPQAASAHGQP